MYDVSLSADVAASIEFVVEDLLVAVKKLSLDLVSAPALF
jgi:hypothetical protein